MSNIENIKKRLNGVEKALLTKAVANDTAKKELRENIAKQLNTLILKTEVEMLEKHLTTGMFTKPVTEPAKAIAKPAIGLGKKIGAAAGKIGRSVGGWGKGIGAAAKTGAATWKDTTPKPVTPAVTKPTKTTTPKTHIDVYEGTTGKKVPSVGDVYPEVAAKRAKETSSKPIATEPPIKQKPHFHNVPETNLAGAKTQLKKKAAPIKQEPIKEPVISGTGEDTAKQLAAAQKRVSDKGAVL